ncbi:MAG: glycosyltransferase [Bryobacterales bacterium]|nr:glycosyltransferase [Bryobacterales bacterium]
MRVAIVHYWLLNMRGGEKVVEALCRLFPEADLFTLFYDPESVSPLIRSRRVTASFLNPLRRYYRSAVPLMPLALEHLDLRGYDLVISSESGPAKGVITQTSTRHVCYCHTPMRFLWEFHHDYLHDWTRGSLRKASLAVFGNYLRLWDYCSAGRVTEFFANSENVRRRIFKAYRRDATVIYPPVAVEEFCWKPAEDYYLVVSELVPYKRIEDAVVACVRSGRRLKIVGKGPEFKRLRRLAGSMVEFCGRVSDGELKDLYARSRALLMPGEEDFGITAVESLASGKPVVALGRGGILEIATAPNAAFLYRDATSAALVGAIEQFEKSEPKIDPRQLTASLGRFSEAEFAAKFKAMASESDPTFRTEPAQRWRQT